MPQLDDFDKIQFYGNSRPIVNIGDIVKQITKVWHIYWLDRWRPDGPYLRSAALSISAICMSATKGVSFKGRQSFKPIEPVFTVRLIKIH